MPFYFNFTNGHVFATICLENGFLTFFCTKRIGIPTLWTLSVFMAVWTFRPKIMTDGGKKKSNLIQEASKNSSWQLNFFQSFIHRIQNRSRFPLTFYGDQHATDLQSSEHWHLEYENQAHQERRLGLFVPPDGSDVCLCFLIDVTA